MKIATHLFLALALGAAASVLFINVGMAAATLAAAGVLTMAVKDYSGRRRFGLRLAA